MPSLNDLAAEIIDIIADYILVQDCATEDVKISDLTKPLMCHGLVHGDESATTRFFSSKDSSLLQLAKVSRYLRNVLFTPRFARVVSMRDSHAWSQSRYAQSLKDQVREFRLVIVPDRTRRHMGLPKLLKQHPGVMKLELVWHLLQYDDFRLQSLQVGQQTEPHDPAQRATVSPIPPTTTLENLMECHISLREGLTSNQSALNRQFHLIMMRISMPRLQHLHISAKLWDYTRVHPTAVEHWRPLMTGIEAGTHNQLEVIEVCLEATLDPREGQQLWRRILEDLVQHFSNQAVSPRIILRLFYLTKHTSDFERQTDGKLSLPRQYVPSESDTRTFISDMPNPSSVDLMLQSYGFSYPFYGRGQPLRLLSVEANAGGGDLTTLQPSNIDDQVTRAATPDGQHYEYVLDYANMEALYTKLLSQEIEAQIEDECSSIASDM